MTPIWAQVKQTHFQFTRVNALTEAWHWLLLVLICLAFGAYVVWIYKRDTQEIRKSIAITLIVLRCCALLGILFYFFNLERVTEESIIKSSRVHVLVDTSQSMGLTDDSDEQRQARISHIINEFADGPTLEELRQQHDVIVHRFSEESRPVEIATYPRVARVDSSNDSKLSDRAINSVRNLVKIGLGLIAAAIIALIFYLSKGRRKDQPEASSWSLLASMVCVIAGVIVVAVGNLRHPQLSFSDTLGITSPDFSSEQGMTDDIVELPEVDWNSTLLPRGSKTRMGDAVQYLVNKERGGPIAGIILYTDGRSNSGEDVEIAVRAARTYNIPLFPVGIGSNEQAKNIRVVDIEAPERVYPGDNFKITGYIQAYGAENRSVTVDLVSRPVNTASDDSSQDKIEDQIQLDLADDGETRPVEFELEPDDSLQGKRDYVIRVQAPPDDKNERDNQRSATVEIVDRRTKVLLLAGGPTREYRFLRNMLFRDDEVEVHVHLQTAEDTISQEADEVVYDFPQLDEELYDYDAIVAFDPDWEALDDSQIELVERWVSEEAGGLFVVAGPVFTPEWSRMRRGRRRGIDLIKNLYPVVFYNQGGVTLSLGRFGGDTAWPIQFSDDGLSAEFLWLDNSQLGSEQAWASFEGVYGFYKAKDPKPGAKVYSRFSDPDTAIDDELPIYMSGHFYGAGRVFFQASGEMWRLRSIEEAYFEKYYTKLIRWVSQGRLLRDSTRGVLLVDKDRTFLGEHITIQAVLTDAQHDPLSAESVDAVLVQPDGTREPIQLKLLIDGSREGMYTGQFIATQEGDYRVEVPLPGSADLLTRDVRVRVPQLEIENPRRNDALLSYVAEQTSGNYFVGISSTLVTPNNEEGRSLSESIVARDQETQLPGTPDKDFEEMLMGWLIAVISGILCVEWIIRRLCKLA
ncbi:MAG: VWA domain-containing protein [Planctomycetaceae bacterium]